MNQSLAAKIGWVFAIVVGVVSCVVMQWRLAPLPSLNVELGPELTVRGTKFFQNDEADSSSATIQTGDKILSLGGQRVKDLRDARVAAIGIQKQLQRSHQLVGPDTSDVTPKGHAAGTGAGAPGAATGSGLSGLAGKGASSVANDLGIPNATGDVKLDGLDSFTASELAPLSYQLLRPRHVFLVSLKDSGGVTKDIYNLMRPNDTLLEIDGRRLPNPVGIEAARSVVNSRPEAVLTIERHDALFSGYLYTSLNLLKYSHLAAFFLVFAVFLLLFIVGRRTDNLAAASMTAVETVLFVWISLLTYRYMWVLADPIIRAGVIISLIFFRPISAIAVAFSQSRSSVISSPRRTGSLWLSILAAIVATGSLLVLNVSDNPKSWELVPQVAGVVLLLFLVYEVISGFTLRARSPIVDRSGYVAGIIGLTCLGAIFAYFSDPNAFLEGRWCMFAMILVGLIWSADLVYVLSGNTTDQMTVVESQTGRANLILDYLESLQELSMWTAFGLVVWRPSGSVFLRRENDALVVENTTKQLHDALEILIQEHAIIPTANYIDAHEAPMSGIAATMGLTLAFTMAPPERAIVVDNAELVAVGFDTHSDSTDSIPLPLEILQSVQDLMTAEVWLSSFLEALDFGDFVPAETGNDHHVELETLRDDLSKARDSIQKAEERNSVLASQRDLFIEQLSELSPRDFEFEPDLVGAFDYLLAHPSPVVISGDFSSGKRLTASAAAMRDSIFDGKKRVIVDAAKTSIEKLTDESFADYIANGTLILENAQSLTTQDLRRCIALSNDHHRLYLLFVDTSGGEDVVLQKHANVLPNIFDPLIDRELMLPGLDQRPNFLQSAINVFLYDAVRLLDKDISGFSDAALETLMRLPWNGGLLELRSVVFYCVAHTKESIIDDELITRFLGMNSAQ